MLLDFGGDAPTSSRDLVSQPGSQLVHNILIVLVGIDNVHSAVSALHYMTVLGDMNPSSSWNFSVILHFLTLDPCFVIMSVIPFSRPVALFA